jgi:orotate phosphoribosyltransferase-like protein
MTAAKKKVNRVQEADVAVMRALKKRGVDSEEIAAELNFSAATVRSGVVAWPAMSPDFNPVEWLWAQAGAAQNAEQAAVRA